MGPKINQMQAIVPEYGKVWYDNNSIENILSPTNLVKKYRVAYDSHKDSAFTVNTNIGIIKFSRNKKGKYVCKTTCTTENYNIITTVEGNMVGFTSRKI